MLIIVAIPRRVFEFMRDTFGRQQPATVANAEEDTNTTSAASNSPKPQVANSSAAMLLSAENKKLPPYLELDATDDKESQKRLPSPNNSGGTLALRG